MRKNRYFGIAVALTLALTCAPATALAAQTANAATNATPDVSELVTMGDESTTPTSVDAASTDIVAQCTSSVSGEVEQAASAAAAKADAQKERKAMAEAYEVAKTDKLLSYDPAAIAAIGSQTQSGHSICCPSYSCAYADAVLDGTVRDHAYYTCSCCTWPDWGGGGSSFRNVGSDEQVLREAYDQIAAGRPTVVHVSWSGGEHWIALIGYENATDPDHLTLANFIALDPVDGAQINAASRYALYGDGCQHVSSR